MGTVNVINLSDFLNIFLSFLMLVVFGLHCFLTQELNPCNRKGPYFNFRKGRWMDSSPRANDDEEGSLKGWQFCFNEQRKWLSPWGFCSLKKSRKKWLQEHLRLNTVFTWGVGMGIDVGRW